MKFGWRPFGSGKKADKCFSKGLSGKIVNCEEHVSGAARLEEVVFDSQVWLDSDVEDYFSVNGDFTPSSDNTPVHPSSVLPTHETYHTNQNLDVAPASSSSDGKKRLSELFGGSFSHETNTSSNDLPVQEAYSNITRNEKPEVRRDVPTPKPVCICS